VITTLSVLVAASVGASADLTGDPDIDNATAGDLVRPDPDAALMAHDAALAGMVISDGPSAHVTKNLAPAGRGVRRSANSTTDVWTLGRFAYTGTFNSPCGGEDDAGIFIWDVHNPNKVTQAGFIPSPPGSRSNDVKVASLNSGDILVHSNESCAGGPGGFEIYNVDDPTNPMFLAHVQVDEIAEITPFFFAPGSLEDNGVHNLWLFTQGPNDYVAAQSEGVFDGFQIFDITDPTHPALVSGWGAEEIFDPGVGDLTLADDPTGARTLNSILWLLGTAPFNGFGASQNRFLHDFTITPDGTRAYLAHWDAGLILLDISDPANPTPISVALDPVNGSIDGEVNSHSVWPNADGTIVVEGEEDFSVFEGETVPGNLSLQNLNTIPGVSASTSTGDTFESNQTGNTGTLTATSLTVNAGSLAGSVFDVVEMTANNVPLGGGSVSGGLVWVGRACPGDTLLNLPAPGDIAIVRRGACLFSDKEANVAAAGAAAVVIANDEQSSVWSGLRIWDYSDPANPVLASTFNTVCSANPADASCDPRGTYSSHNVIVEDSSAYVSWYSDGVLVIDISDPYDPVEVGRYHRAGVDFEAENGGIQNVWGIYKEENAPWIYASDRNGGLYVLKEYGAGSARGGQQ
jgi:hypothetical protein